MEIRPGMSDNIWQRIQKCVLEFEQPRILEWGSGGTTFAFLQLISQKGGRLRSIEHGFTFFQLVENSILDALNNINVDITKKFAFDNSCLNLWWILLYNGKSAIQSFKNSIKFMLGKPYISKIQLFSHKYEKTNWLGIWWNPLLCVGDSESFIIKGNLLDGFRPVNEGAKCDTSNSNSIFEKMEFYCDTFNCNEITGRILTTNDCFDGLKQIEFKNGRRSLWCPLGLMPSLEVNLYNTEAQLNGKCKQVINSKHYANSRLKITNCKIPNEFIPFITTELKTDNFSFRYEYRPWVNNASGFIKIEKYEGQYQLILIDSKDPTRMKCVEYARRNNLLAKGGYIVIHDAHRYENNPTLKRRLPKGEWMDGSGRLLNTGQLCPKITKEAYIWKYV